MALEEAEVISNLTYPVAPAERWRLTQCDPKQVLFIGRFDRHKGYDLIVEAFGKFLRQCPTPVSEDGRRWDVAGNIDEPLPGARASDRINIVGMVPNSNRNVARFGVSR